MTNTAIQLTRVSAGDVNTLKEIGIDTFNEAFAHLNTPENMAHYLNTAFTDQKLLEEINNPCSEFYMARLDNRVIGYLKISYGPAQTELKDNEGLEIERIYVLQEFHGKKVGQTLFNKGLDIAATMKKSYVWLGVWEHNAKALAFYKKNGFEVFDSHEFRLGDDLQTDLMMKRNLV